MKQYLLEITFCFIALKMNILWRSKEEIVIEAKKRLGEIGYCVISKNCQHFVSECRNGRPYSPEVDKYATGVVLSIGAMSVFLIYLSNLFTAKKTKKKQSEQRTIVKFTMI